MPYLEPALEATTSHRVAPRMYPQSTSRHGLDEQLSTGTVRLVKAREHLYSAGEPRTHLYRIECGSMCLYKIMPDGRRQVIDFAYAGDVVGLGTGSEHAVNAQALEPTRLKCFPVATLSRLAGRDPELGVKLYEAMSRELAAAQDHLFTIGQRNACERVACFLVTLARRNERRGKDATTLVLPMTRADIADFLGLTIETVSRTLTKLRLAKLIDLEQCTLIHLLEPDKLERIASGEAAI